MLDAIARAAASRPDKTMLATVLAGNETVQLDGITVPTYRFPESAVRALAHMASRSEWLQSIDATMPDQLIDRALARAVVSDFLRGVPEGGWLDMPAAVALATAAGFPLVETAIVSSLDDAVAAATRLGFPVALKGAGASILHKTDLGAVVLSLADEQAVIAAGSAMRETPRRPARGVRRTEHGALRDRVACRRGHRPGVRPAGDLRCRWNRRRTSEGSSRASCPAERNRSGADDRRAADLPTPQRLPWHAE